jgi:SHS2 domain-containing protein
MVDLQCVEPLVTCEVAVTASDRERLLVAWLAELIFLTETDGLVFSSFEVEIDPEGRSLRGRARGEPLDEVRHDAGYHVKAVTYHDLEVVESPAGWSCQVIVDV